MYFQEQFPPCDAVLARFLFGEQFRRLKMLLVDKQVERCLKIQCASVVVEISSIACVYSIDLPFNEPSLPTGAKRRIVGESVFQSHSPSVDPVICDIVSELGSSLPQSSSSGVVVLLLCSEPLCTELLTDSALRRIPKQYPMLHVVAGTDVGRGANRLGILFRVGTKRRCSRRR